MLIQVIFYWMKKHENILIYSVSYKTSHGAKPFCIIFHKIDGYFRKYDRTKYLALFHFNKKYKRIFERIR